MFARQAIQVLFSPVVELVLVVCHLPALQVVFVCVDVALPASARVASSDIVRGGLGMSVQGKSDFDAIENFRGNWYCRQALRINLLPSCPRAIA